MKRYLSIIILTAAIVLLPSCKETFGVSYSISAVGDANGVVSVTFPNGSFESNGSAAINFAWDNDTTNLATVKPMTLEQAYASNDAEIVKAASYVDEWLSQNFNAASASGDYYIHLQGYVIETLTGLKLSIDKEFTNR